MVQVRRVSPEMKASQFSFSLLLWALACIAILASSSWLASPTPSPSSLFSSPPTSSAAPLPSFLHDAKHKMVRNTEADRRANAQRRAVSALSSAKHAAHRRPPSENARHSASTATAGMQETKARMRRDVDASEAQIKILSSQLPLAERRAFPKEARQVEEVLGKAAAQLDSINRKAARNPTKKTRSTREALHTVSHGVLQAAKAADDKENSALAGESDASDVLNAVNHLPSPPKRSHRSSKVASQNKARTQDLADVSDHREWGKIYEPTGEKGRVSGLEKKEYDGWSKEVNDISSVYDPVHDTRPSVSNVRGDWWRDRAYVIKGTSGVDHGDDDWWVHNHAGRGY